MKKILCLAIFLSFSYSSYASSIKPTKIKEILTGPSFGGKVFLVIDPNPSNAPECQTNSRYSYVFDGTSEEGKLTTSLTLAAYAAQKDVWLAGYNICSLYGGVENLKHIVVQ